MRLQWLNEFSDIGNELQSSEALNLLKVESTHLQYNNISAQYNNSDFDASSAGAALSGQHSLKKKQTCLVKCVDLSAYESMLENFDKREFDIFAFSRLVGERKRVLPICMINAIDQLELQPLINDTKLESFLKCI